MKQKDSGSRAKNAGISLIVIMTMLISVFAVLATPTTIAQDYIGGPYGGGLRVALKSQPSSLNPLASTLNESATQIIDLLYEPLGRIDPYTLKLKPWLASSWAVNAVDTSVVSVTLKSGIYWHDDTEMTLNDVEYTFGPSGYNIDYITSMTKDTDTNTITFDLEAPDSRFFSEMMLMKIVPVGFNSTSAPKGCGPFKFVSSDATSTSLEAFGDHFVARPYIDTITYTYYPYAVGDFNANYPYTQIYSGEDPRYDGLYRAAFDLMTDKLDFIGWDLLTEQITLNVEIGGNNTNLLQNANSTTMKSSGLNQWYLGFNNLEGHILNDVALRKAISYAMNKDKLTIYDISGGLESANSVISKYNLPWFNSSVTYPSYDITMARKILKDAGYDDYNSSGFIDKPGPDPNHPEIGYESFSLTLFGPQIEDVTPYTMSTNIITWFEILGLNVTLVNDTMEVHMANILADDFDMYLANENSATLDPQFINDIYHSENVATNMNLLNFEGKCLIENSSLMSQLVDNETWTAQLDHTKLIGTPLVYHNGTLLDVAWYNISMDDGLFTLNSSYTLDYEDDMLNITYSYLVFDSVIEKANSQMEPASREKYIKDAQAVLKDMVPSLPLFTYMVSHAYKTNLYVGWVQTLGGINNYWTFTNLKNKMIGDSTVTISSVKNFINDGESMNLFVSVQDLQGASIEATELLLTGEGTFGIPIFDSGQYTIPYTAPSTSTSRTITLTAKAFTIGYVTDSDSLDITVHPLMMNFNIDISRGATSLESGNTTSVTVIVKDRTSNTVISGANVVLTMTPAGLGGYLEEVSGTTNAAGEFVTTFGSNNVTIDTTFRITAYVSMSGYVDASQTTSIGVSRDPNIQVTSDKGFLGLPAPSFMAIIVLLSGMSVAFAIYRRKRY
ncbi:MAG: hypothetical protein KKH41_05620 [Candidatus Thermoplasmatota archaeon]|nr:hypothetical protein [Candidatus Thermoplasmatota archaeon]MBU4070629.1 hypothetical protein [Candidatus Thermoplasmatota archaeon]MBU4143984.1 hypothetical protein [Candidatus Thermoplasmatota archaeon]MBU4592046.1 hypothetical protein [Candidatus Thermoplasmatota archaeon]